MIAVALLGACSRGSAPQAGAVAAPVEDAGAAAARAPEDAGPATTSAPEGSGAAPAARAPEAAAASTTPRRDPPSAGAPTSAQTAAPVAAPLSAAVAVVAGKDLPIDRGGSTLVDIAASFRVEIAAPLADGRLALHDEQDAMVASTGTSEVGASWTRYQLVPDQPLRPGSSYALRIDGAAASEVHDIGGRTYAPVVLKLKTAGERPAPAPSSKKKRAKRRH